MPQAARPLPWSLLALALLSPLFGFACNGAGESANPEAAGVIDTTSPDAARTPTAAMESGSRYFHREEGNKGVIVFAHGVLGNSRGTWTNQKTKAYWPKLIKEDDTFGGFDIYLYEFATPLVGKALSIGELADDMNQQFKAHGIFDHDDVIFLCHSMGGLVTRAFLQRYQPNAAKVTMIAFYSTPGEGSDIGRIAKFLSKNPQYGNMVPLKQDNYLAEQMRGWLGANFPIPSYCAYEAKTTYTQQVVPMDSAAALCNRPLLGILGNHMEVVKPKGEEDKPYIFFKNAFAETRPVIAMSFDAGTTLRRAVEVVVASDRDGGGGFTHSFVGCDDTFLDSALRSGEVRAGTRERFIAELGERVQGSQKIPKLVASRNIKRAHYEIRCEN